MDKWIFRIAGFFVVAVLFAHEFLGSPMVLPPLQNADLPENVVWLHHFSWHVGSVTMMGMACLFFLGSRDSTDLSMVVVATGMSAGFSLLGISLAVSKSASLWGTPAPYAWSIASIVGLVGTYIRWKKARNA